MMAPPAPLVFIPGGSAILGCSPSGESGTPVVPIPGFCITKLTVTNRDYAKFIEAGGYMDPTFWHDGAFQWVKSQGISEPAFWRDPRFNDPTQPVTGISLWEAQAYAKSVGGRLPREIEWEKAARGIDGRTFPWGDAPPSLNHANFAPDFVPVARGPIAAEALPAGDSPYGCRQMAGNVWEWCLDKYHANTSFPDGRFVETRPSDRQVVKGGAWTAGQTLIRPASRWGFQPQLRDNILGFRVVFEDSQ